MIDEFELADIIQKLTKIRNENQPFATGMLNPMIETLTDLGREVNPCEFTMSHTRTWCGHPLCREG